VRDRKVYVVQAHLHRPEFSIDSAIAEHRLLVSAAAGGAAKEVVGVGTYWGYSRQDRKSKPREPTSSAVVFGDFETVGAKVLMGFDLHSQPTQSFFRGVFIQMTAFFEHQRVMKEVMEGRDPDLFKVVAPDAGRVKVSEDHANHLGVGLAIINKVRDLSTGEITGVHVVGDVEGQDCFITEDVITTGKTLSIGGKALLDAGASRVYALATHLVATPEIIDYIGPETSPFEAVWTTNTLPQDGNEVRIKNPNVIDIHHVLGETIIARTQGRSVSDYFKSLNYS